MAVLELLASHVLAFVLLATLLGLLVGSFLNVVIYRLPIMMQRSWEAQARECLDLPEAPSAEPFNLARPDSRCPSCGHRIRPWENIPVLSWLWLRARCSSCKVRISARYPLVELISGVLSGFVAWYFGFGWAASALIVLTWALLALSMIDFDHQLLPDAIVLPFLWLGLLLNSFGVVAPLHDALWGAVGGYLSLWSVYWVFKLVTGKEGIGYGDFKLLAMLGAWGGWQVLPLTILLSSVVGAVLGAVLLRVRGEEMGTALPFGPYLAIAGWIALLWGDVITERYLQLMSF